MLEVAAVRQASLDCGMRDPCHLRGDGGVGFAATCRTEGLSRDVALELVAHEVFATPDGNTPGEPEGRAQATIAALGELLLAALLSRLTLREIQSTEPQELSVMREASQITRFCKDGQGKDGTNAENRLELAIVGIIGEERIRLRFEHLTLRRQIENRLQAQAVGGDGGTLQGDRHCHRMPRRLVDDRQPNALADLAARRLPRGQHEGVEVSRDDARGGGYARSMRMNCYLRLVRQ